VLSCLRVGWKVLPSMCNDDYVWPQVQHDTEARCVGLQQELSTLESQLHQANKTHKHEVAKFETAAASWQTAQQNQHHALVKQLEKEHEEAKRQAVQQIEDVHAHSRRRLAEVAGDAEADLVREHALDVRRRHEAAQMRMHALENTHTQELEALRTTAARDQAAISEAQQKQQDEQRAHYTVNAAALTANLQQAGAIAQKWRLAHDKLAESMHQLLLVLETRVQPSALRTGKEGKEGAGITAMRKLLGAHASALLNDSHSDWRLVLNAPSTDDGAQDNEGGGGGSGGGVDGGDSCDEKESTSAYKQMWGGKQTRADDSESAENEGGPDGGSGESVRGGRGSGASKSPHRGRKAEQHNIQHNILANAHHSSKALVQGRLWEQSGVIRWDDLYAPPNAEKLHAHFVGNTSSPSRARGAAFGGSGGGVLKMKGAGAPVGTPRGIFCMLTNTHTHIHTQSARVYVYERERHTHIHSNTHTHICMCMCVHECEHIALAILILTYTKCVLHVRAHTGRKQREFSTISTPVAPTMPPPQVRW